MHQTTVQDCAQCAIRLAPAKQLVQKVLEGEVELARAQDQIAAESSFSVQMLQQRDRTRALLIESIGQLLKSISRENVSQIQKDASKWRTETMSLLITLSEDHHWDAAAPASHSATKAPTVLVLRQWREKALANNTIAPVPFPYEDVEIALTVLWCATNEVVTIATEVLAAMKQGFKVRKGLASAHDAGPPSTARLDELTAVYEKALFDRRIVQAHIAYHKDTAKQGERHTQERKYRAQCQWALDERRKELVSLAQYAQTHYPEALVSMSVLREHVQILSGDRMASDRTFDEYECIGVPLAASPHVVHRVRFNGTDHVLKVYALTSVAAQRVLARELRILARLSHPHVIPIETSFVERNMAYVQFPYYPGGSLAVWLATHTTTVGTMKRLALMQELLRAIAVRCFPHGFCIMIFHIACAAHSWTASGAL